MYNTVRYSQGPSTSSHYGSVNTPAWKDITAHLVEHQSPFAFWEQNRACDCPIGKACRPGRVFRGDRHKTETP
jgi:hypothetical protein